MSVSEASCVCVSGGRGLGGAMGVDGGWPPLPTRPQQYCDPASLVQLILLHPKFCVTVLHTSSFLGASKQLFKRLRSLVGLSVGWSVTHSFDFNGLIGLALLFPPFLPF